MALQQTTIIDKIEIVENGTIQIRQRTDIFDDANPENIIASQYHRESLTPGQDISNQDLKIANIAKAVWTDEIISAYKAQVEIQNI